MPVGDQSILEVLVRQLAFQGIDDVSISIGYLGHLIEAVIGDGSDLGAKVTYLREDQPLGTAGPLALLPALTDDDAVLVLNGDTLTDLDFGSVVAAHVASGADLTVVAQPRTYAVDFGVLQVDQQGDLVSIAEKPSFEHLCNMGIYIVGARAVQRVLADVRTDMPQLLASVLSGGGRVHVESVECTWLDLGRLGDFEQAVAVFADLRPKILPDA